MFQKFSAGAAKAFQHNITLMYGKTMGWFAMLSHYYTGPGYYNKEFIVSLVIKLYLFSVVFLGNSIYPALGTVMHLVMLGLLLTYVIVLPGLNRSIYELGPIKGFFVWLADTLRSMIMFVAHVFTQKDGHQNKGMNNKDDYVKTGRPAALHHNPMFAIFNDRGGSDPNRIRRRYISSSLYENYHDMHIRPARLMLVMSAVGIYWFWNLSIIFAFPFILAGIALFIAGIVYNPASTPLDSRLSDWWKLYKADWKGYFALLTKNSAYDFVGEHSPLEVAIDGLAMLLFIGIISIPAWIISKKATLRGRIAAPVIGAAAAVGLGVSTGLILLPIILFALSWLGIRKQKDTLYSETDYRPDQSAMQNLSDIMGEGGQEQ
jgi:hypothetical protein